MTVAEEEKNITYLFCLAYAGASAQSVFGQWARYLPDNVIPVPLDLPGHGAQMQEPFGANIEEIAKGLWQQMQSLNPVRNYAIFGHSLGAIFAYELSKIALQQGRAQPCLTVVSGSRPPHVGYGSMRCSSLPRDDLIYHMVASGGLSEEVLTRKSVVDIFLPVLRSDYRIAEQYRFQPPPVPMSSNVLCLRGNQDTLVEQTHTEQWKQYSSHSFTERTIPGGHFFINTHGKLICDLIGNHIAALRTYPEPKKVVCEW